MENKIKSTWEKFTSGSKNDVIRRVVILVLSILVIVSGVMSIVTYIDKERTAREYEELQQLAQVQEETKETPTPTPEATEEPVEEMIEEPTANPFELVSDYPKIDLDYEALYEINSDLVGWIYIPALGLSYPVVQYPEPTNDFYLEYSFEKEPSILGAIFMDWESPADWTDENTLVFGHNMKDKSMFGSLKRFLYEDGLVQSDPYVYIYTEEEVLIYQIFSYYVTTDGSQRYRIVRDPEDLAAYVNEAKELSEFDPGEEFDNMDHLISLSTCHGIPGTPNRFLVHGVLVERGEREIIIKEE